MVRFHLSSNRKVEECYAGLVEGLLGPEDHFGGWKGPVSLSTPTTPLAPQPLVICARQFPHKKLPGVEQDSCTTWGLGAAQKERVLCAHLFSCQGK